MWRLAELGRMETKTDPATEARCKATQIVLLSPENQAPAAHDAAKRVQSVTGALSDVGEGATRRQSRQIAREVGAKQHGMTQEMCRQDSRMQLWGNKR